MTERDADDNRKPKTASETARRVLALLAVVGKVHDPERTIAWMEQHNIEPFLSPAELAFIQDSSPSEQSLVEFSWRAEAMVPLIWALSGLSDMPMLNDQFNVFDNAMINFAVSAPIAFIASAELRNAKEIEGMEGYLYHQHWRVRDAELGSIGKLLDLSPDDPPIEDLNHSIVYERRYALSWLVGWGDEWDNVPAET